jgi:hypothetical protein
MGVRCDYFCDTQDVINNVPPHWMDGVIEQHGSRHAGQVSRSFWYPLHLPASVAVPCC